MEVYLRTIVEIVNFIFLLYVSFYTVFLFISVIYGAVQSEKKARENKYHNDDVLNYAMNYIPVSILVPAYNEEVTILDTVQSLCLLDYPEFEVVVIDDGSKDDTSKILINALKLEKTARPIHREVKCRDALEIYETVYNNVPITLVKKINGGKGDALNMGINVSKYPYFLSLDADSILQKDTLKKIIMPVLTDSRVIAVGGMVQVANETIIENGEVKKVRFPHKFVVLMQLLEYARTFLAMRIFLDSFNSNLIISGTCGLFQKDIVKRTGGYKTDTVGEDMELVVKLHAYCRSKKTPYKIAYAPDAICWTQVPTRLKDLKSQRRRWQMGLMQSLYAHRIVLFNPLYGVMGVISTIYYLMIELLGPFIEFLGFLVIVLASYLELLNIPFMIFYFILFYFLNSLITITAFFTRSYILNIGVSFWQTIKVIILSFTESFFFHHVVTFFRLSAIINYRKSRLQWGKIQRNVHTHTEDIK